MTTLSGMTGANPRDFLAALGLLRIATLVHRDTRLWFNGDGAFAPEIDGIDRTDLSTLIAADAEKSAPPQPWRLEYEKGEKKGTKRVADLKPPPARFREFVQSTIALWVEGRPEAAAYAAAFAADGAVDGKGNTKPTALHFTAANQQFLDTIEKIRVSIDRAWCDEALFIGHADRSGPNLRWDPAADRAYALMATNPTAEGTSVNAPLEWLAFRALPLLPVVPRASRGGIRAETTAIQGRRKDEMRFRWPLWSVPASLQTVASLIRLDWWPDFLDRTPQGVFAVCTSEIRRTAQGGFGNFGPAQISA